ncbi:MAG: aromatic amino acid transport family protein [Candidatus Uhrbacteria bacterium]
MCYNDDMKKLPGHIDWPWWRAVGTMIGGVVGVGVFGLPFAFAQSGWALGLVFLLIIGFLLLFLNLMYAEVVSQTSGKHRLAGYVKKYLGKIPGHFAAIIFIFYVWGAMLAQMLIGGDFLFRLVSPIFGGPIIIYQIFVAVLVSALTFRGLKKLAKIEFFIICALLFLFAFITLVALPSIDWSNISSFHLANWFIPYGVIFFAFSGLGVIPEMKDVLSNKGREKNLAHAILTGQIIILFLYAIFTFAVVGITGSATTQAAFDGLASVFGQTFAVIGSLFGLITVISIFSVVSMETQNIFHLDYHWPQKISWALASFVPVGLLFLGIKEFVGLVGFLGGVFGGLIGLLVIAVYEKMRHNVFFKTHHCLNVPRPLVWLLVMIFVGGIVQTIFSL